MLGFLDPRMRVQREVIRSQVSRQVDGAAIISLARVLNNPRQRSALRHNLQGMGIYLGAIHGHRNPIPRPRCPLCKTQVSEGEFEQLNQQLRQRLCAFARRPAPDANL